MILKPAPVSSSHFSFKNNVFIAELSEVPVKHFQRVFDDACDLGFTIISAKTGNHVVFAIDRYELDADDDLVAIHFKCVTPKFKNLTAVLLND